jgi:universal stress protein E
MQRFKKILVFVGTRDSETAINRAVTLALKNEASLTLMDVVKPLPTGFGILRDVAQAEVLQRLIARDHRESLLKRAAEYSDTGVPIEVIVTIGDPAREVVREVVTNGFDLVVKTADGLTAAGRMFGSIAQSLLRNCPCPVWVLKPEIHGPFNQIVAAVDMETDDEHHRGLNREILELAFSLAKKEAAELHIVTAWDLWMEKTLRRRLGDKEVDAARANQESKVRLALDELLQAPVSHVDNIHLHVLHGPAAVVIRSVVDDVEADLLVMGTVSRTGIAGFLIGNTAENVLAGLTCSVLALKPEGFVSPVKYDATDAVEYAES